MKIAQVSRLWVGAEKGTMTLRPVFLALFLLGAGLVASAQGIHRTIRPTFFAPDDEERGFEDSKPPSDAVLDALLQTKEAKDAQAELSAMSRGKLRGLFQVVQVDIGPSGEEDYIALGSLPLSGADCYWFWLVRSRHGHAEVLLFLNDLSLTIRKKQTNGYRDIQAEWATAAFIGTRVYRYDGSRYKLVWERTKRNR